MNISDIIILNDWLKKQIDSTDVLDKIKNLLSILQNNTTPTRSVNGRIMTQEPKPFKEEKEEFLKAIREINIFQLNANQRYILEIHGIKGFFGEKASREIELLFIENNKDIAYIRDYIESIEINLIKALEDIYETANDLEKYKDFLKVNKHNIDITFKNETAINNFKDLEKQSKQWKIITHNISASIPNDDKLEITNVENGSIIIGLVGTSLGLALLAEIIKKASLIIRLSIVEYKDIYRVLDLDPETDDFKEELEKIRGAVDELSKKRSDTAISKAVKEIKEKLKTILKEGNETDIHISSALKGVVRHIAGGGEAEVTLSEDDKKNMQEQGVQLEVIEELSARNEPLLITNDQRQLIENKFMLDESDRV